jgi:hypothetical protein
VKTFSDIAALWRQMGVVRFTVFFVLLTGLIACYALVFTQLEESIGWPEAYGFSCRRKCLVVHMWHSHKLLAGGSANELALFAMTWCFIAVPLAIGLPIVAKRWFKKRRKRIRPMPSD